MNFVTTFLLLLIYLNENEKRQWCLIYFVCKYSEEDCSSRGELTDVIRYAAVCRITRLYVAPSAGAHTPESNSCKSELPRMQVRNLRTCYWETRADLTLSHQTICLIFSVLRPGWKCRQQQVWGKKFLGHIFPGSFGVKAPYVSQN